MAQDFSHWDFLVHVTTADTDHDVLVHDTAIVITTVTEEVIKGVNREERRVYWETFDSGCTDRRDLEIVWVRGSNTQSAAVHNREIVSRSPRVCAVCHVLEPR